jgi:hypothetical protein
MACTFGTGGDWKATVIALIIGGYMSGWLSKVGLLLLKIFTKATKKEDKQIA